MKMEICERIKYKRMRRGKLFEDIAALRTHSLRRNQGCFLPKI